MRKKEENQGNSSKQIYYFVYWNKIWIKFKVFPEPHNYQSLISRAFVLRSQPLKFPAIISTALLCLQPLLWQEAAYPVTGF